MISTSTDGISLKKGIILYEAINQNVYYRAKIWLSKSWRGQNNVNADPFRVNILVVKKEFFLVSSSFGMQS